MLSVGGLLCGIGGKLPPVPKRMRRAIRFARKLAAGLLPELRLITWGFELPAVSQPDALARSCVVRRSRPRRARFLADASGFESIGQSGSKLKNHLASAQLQKAYFASRATRNPRFGYRDTGVLILRNEERDHSGRVCQAPPRRTRWLQAGPPLGSSTVPCFSQSV